MIDLRNVSVTYANNHPALWAVDLTFRRGEFTVLIGPSGAGKSTLLRCLNLLTQPTLGEVHVEGLGTLDRRRLMRRHRRQTGMIFQQHHLIARLTAMQNVLQGRLGYHSIWSSLWPLPRAERRLALHCLDRVGLLHKALERAENLSGGEQQRVGIARALAQQPRLLLADEPIASLDPATAEHVLALIHQVVVQDGLTCVVSLHQLDLAKRYADRIIGLNQGRVVFDGTPGQLVPEVVESLYPVPINPGLPTAVNGPSDKVSLTGAQP